MRVTLLDAKNELRDAAGSAGIRTDDAALLDYINRAQREIHKAGTHPDSYEQYNLETPRNFISLPEKYEGLIYAEVQDQETKLRNLWHEFIQYGPKSLTSTGQVDLVDQGFFPLEVPLATTELDNWSLRMYAQQDESVDGQDLKVHISFVSFKGNDSYQINENGVREDWVTVTIPSTPPYEAVCPGISYSDDQISVVTRIRYDRPRKGKISFYRTDNDIVPTPSSINDLISTHDYYYLEPTFRKYIITGFGDSTDEANNKKIECIAKKKFRPVVNDSDLLLISDIEAIRHMLKAFGSESENDIESYMVRKRLSSEEIADANKARSGMHKQPFINFGTTGFGGLGNIR